MSALRTKTLCGHPFFMAIRMKYAHSTDTANRTDWQRLSDHLRQTARLAADRGRPLGLAKAAGAAGLLHDLGKYDPAFQRRLEGSSERVDHSTAGGALIRDLAGTDERWAADLLGYAILGHHAGLPNRVDATEGCVDRRLERFDDRLDPIWRDELPVDLAGASREFFGRATPGEFMAFELSMAARMVFSCLVDADFRDTEAFYAAIEGRIQDRDWEGLQTLVPAMTSALETTLAGLPADGDLNALRRSVLAHVRAQARREPGLFTLTVPTGGGKTLASLAFALDHARAHGLRRIIYAIPFTSIIDQTAAIFREMFGDDVVLEHHSAIDEEGRETRSRAGRDKLRLAMEDWAAPLVVTTNVQLFESLFAARTSRARKLHNIAGSVIVLDEPQALPRDLLAPCLRAIDVLARRYGCTVVMCTATQPAFDSRHLKSGGLALEGRELAPDPTGLARTLRRARVRLAGPMEDASLVAALTKTRQGLVIVNTRGHALTLFRAVQEAGLEGAIHLTTRQCAAHRQEVLADIRSRLCAGDPCRVIATSLVEAGVDLDFPRVWRAEAGLDSVVQAAGRCNREGTRPLQESLVDVFAAPEHPGSAEMRAFADILRRTEAKHPDLLSPGALRFWFEEVYWRRGALVDRKGILDRFRCSVAGSNFAFRDAAEAFRMIETAMVPVITPWTAEAEEAVARLNVESVPSSLLARALQRHVVLVPPVARASLVSSGHASFSAPLARGDQFCVLAEPTLYQSDVGLLWENADYLSVEQTMV